MIAYVVMIQENSKVSGQAYVEKQAQGVAEHIATQLYRNMHLKTAAVVRITPTAKLKCDKFQVVFKLQRFCGCGNFQKVWTWDDTHTQLVCMDCGVVVAGVDKEKELKKAMKNMEEELIESPEDWIVGGVR